MAGKTKTHEDPEAARAFLDAWIKDAMASEIRVLAKVAKTLAAYRIGLLNYLKTGKKRYLAAQPNLRYPNSSPSQPFAPDQPGIRPAFSA